VQADEISLAEAKNNEFLFEFVPGDSMPNEWVWMSNFAHFSLFILDI